MYLESLYKELYIKNIFERYNVECEDILKDILDFLAFQISSLTNPTNIANSIASMKKNPTLVSKYIEYITKSFLINTVKRFNIKGKSYSNYPNKYYYIDSGLLNIRLNFRQFDSGQLMENIIYTDLLRRGYSVNVGVVYDRTNGSTIQKGIDFVVNDCDRKLYIQSAFRMHNDNKTNLELSSLMLTKDFFKKIIIRIDIPHQLYDENGILHCNLIDFLLGKVELF